MANHKFNTTFEPDDNLSMLDFVPLNIEVDWTRFDIIINKLLNENNENNKLKELLNYNRFTDVYHIKYGCIIDILYEKSVFENENKQEYENKNVDYDGSFLLCDAEYTFIIKDIDNNYVLLHVSLSPLDSFDDLNIKFEYSQDPKYFWNFVLTPRLRKKIIATCDDA